MLIEEDCECEDEVLSPPTAEASTFSFATNIANGEITYERLRRAIKIPGAFLLEPIGVQIDQAILAIARVHSLFELSRRYDLALDRIRRKPRFGVDVTVYYLTPYRSGHYNDYSGTKSSIRMDPGQIWKIGQTKNPLTRYSRNSYERKNFIMNSVYVGTRTDALIYEIFLLTYYVGKHDRLPPGNRIFK